MPHEMFYTKNKNRRERRQINLLHKHRHKVLCAIKKNRVATEELLRLPHPPLQKPKIIKQIRRLVS